MLQVWTGTGAPSPLLGQRLAEILVGSLITLLVAWFLLPVRGEGALRSRISPLLAQLVGADPPEFEAALAAFDAVAAPYDAVLRVAPRARRPRALGWVATTRSCVGLAAEGGVAGAAPNGRGGGAALRDPECRAGCT